MALLVAQAVVSSLLAVCAFVDLAAWGMATWVRTPLSSASWTIAIVDTTRAPL